MRKLCAAEHLAKHCVGPASIFCGACGAVRYCCSSHQRLHWPEHRNDCSRFEEQMRLGAVVHDFPFTFTHQSTFQIDKGILSTCSFFESLGVHAMGAWRAECDCYQMMNSRVGRSSAGWNLPSGLCPCTGVVNTAPHLEGWSDYYSWRGLPFDSPVAILLHFPLTLLHSLHLLAAKTSKNQLLTVRKLHVHYLGPNHEVDQLEVFAELATILPIQHMHIDLIGADVPSSRNFEELQLFGHPKCSDAGCNCKSTLENAPAENTLTFKLWKGFYHDIYNCVAEKSPPDIIFAPNAGIAAFPSWVPTLELINRLRVPAIFTDFCEEAAVLAVKCINEVLECQVTIPIQVNPFRQPMTPPCKVMELPTYSNCFLFGMN